MNVRRYSRCLFHLLVLFFLLLPSACLKSPVPNALYTLHATEEKPLGNEFVNFKDMILVMPVRMAPQLQNRGLLYQHSPNEAKSAANHLWAGPLDQQIAASITANLKILLATDNVAVFPGPRFGKTRYQVEVEIQDFSGDANSFSISAVYTISDNTSYTILQRKSFQQRQINTPAGFSGYAASASSALGALSREVSLALITAHRSQTDTSGLMQ